MANTIPPRRDEALISESGQPTLRFAEYLESIARQTDSNTTNVSIVSDSSLLSLIFALENRIGSGDALTSDETGFTVDSDRLSVDQTEA